MPTDGTLLLEQLPRAKQYLLTGMSVFFSVGAVLSSIVALFVIPRYSCASDSEHCDVSKNSGWRYLLIILAILVRSPCIY